MNRTLDDAVTDALAGRAQTVADELARTFPGEPAARQPVHTVYGGANLFRPDTAARLGTLASRALDAYAPDAETFAAALGLDSDRVSAGVVYDRVREKLEREPVEDFRLDFEDGYGNRPDDEEDACAASAATAVADGLEQGTLPPFIGIRIKPFTGELHRRALRTLDGFVTTLAARTGGVVPPNFVVTVPKVMVPEQVAIAATALARLEQGLGLEDGSLRMEIMVETTQSIVGADGRCPLPALVEAGDGRCVAAHFGVYDYTASCSITAQHQSMRHPACDHARHAMQVALGGRPVTLSDGATNIMPVAPHRAADGATLTPDQDAANRTAVHRAWRLHYDDVRHSLRHAFYQGWDLHPAQLPTRYAAVSAFFLESYDSAALRLRTFVERAAQATLVGDVFDDAATGQGLLNFFLRGLSSGALTEDEVRATGLSIDELRTRSFVRILAGRKR